MTLVTRAQPASSLRKRARAHTRSRNYSHEERGVVVKGGVVWSHRGAVFRERAGERRGEERMAVEGLR